MVQKEVEENPCPMTEGEWVQYLQSYIEINVTNILSGYILLLTAFVVAMGLMSISFPKDLPQLTLIIFFIIFILITLYYYASRSRLSRSYIKEIQSLINEIIEGNINPNEIRNKWIDLNKNYHKFCY